MHVDTQKLIERIFFFTILIVAGYLVWKLFAPFAGTLALSAIVVTICYPIQAQIARLIPSANKSFIALLSLIVVFIVIVLPLAILASFIFREAFSIYSVLGSTNGGGLVQSINQIESAIQVLIPTFSIDVAEVLRQTAGYIVDSALSIFAGTATTIFLFFIALIGTYYFFRDGKAFTKLIIKVSPLQDVDDELVIKRVAVAVRSVALGTVFIALIQGVLTALGFAVFGFDRFVLWGSIGAIGALVPSVGTTIVIVPAVLYLLYTGAATQALLFSLWGVLIVGLVDNIIGPQLWSRGNKMHPFMILLAVLGGIAYFGPIGFILGPVILSLFLVLLELYNAHIKDN